MAISFRYLLSAAIALLLVAAAVVWKWGDVEAEPAAGAIPAHSDPQPVEADAPVARVPDSDEASSPWFRTQTATGIDFRHDSGTSPEKPFPAANGSGIAVVDFDLDGLLDLYFATGTDFPVDEQRAAPFDQFYRNVGGWRFEKMTAKARLRHTGYSAGVAIGDYNDDGFPDIYVACYQANVLYRNLGDGTFAALGANSGALDPRWATSAAMFDFDADGFLDVYVCNYGKWTLEDNRWCGDQSSNIRYFCSPRSIPPEVDALLHNRGDDTFEDTASAAGLAGREGRSQGIIAADVDGDGAVDLYVGNDLNANSLFLNQGGGTFQDATETSGVAYDHLGVMQAGMGVDAADTNGDGLAELLVTNFAGEHNAFYENQGQGLFHDVSQQRGLYAEGLPWVGWGTALTDLDLDGWLDLVVTNGHVDDNRPGIPYAAPALLWRNEAGKFSFVGAAAGEYFTGQHVGRALAVADLDNDGDQDLVIGHQDDAPALLQNESRSERAAKPHCITLRLIGTTCNRDAIGSSVTLHRGSLVQLRQVKGGGSYLSSHDARLVFAIPREAQSASFEIRWADGSTSMIDDLAQDRAYIIIQPASSEATARVICTREL